MTPGTKLAIIIKQSRDGSTIKDVFCTCGGVAHLGERLNGIQEVRGSIPLISTKLQKKHKMSIRVSDAHFYFASRPFAGLPYLACKSKPGTGSRADFVCLHPCAGLFFEWWKDGAASPRAIPPAEQISRSFPHPERCTAEYAPTGRRCAAGKPAPESRSRRPPRAAGSEPPPGAGR